MPFPFPLPLSTLLGRVQAIFIAEFERLLADAGMGDLSLALGTNVMRHLTTEQGVRLGALAEVAGVSKQAISQQVAYLQERGYVLVEPDPDDQRAKCVRLTDRGAWSQRTARPLFRELEQKWRQEYGEEDIARLREVLEHILERLDDTEVAGRAAREQGRPSP